MVTYLLLTVFACLTHYRAGVIASENKQEWAHDLGTVHVCEGDKARLAWTPLPELGHPLSLTVTKPDPLPRELVRGEGGRTPAVLDSRASFSPREGLVIYNVSTPDGGFYKYAAIFPGLEDVRVKLESEAYVEVYPAHDCPDAVSYLTPVVQVKHVSGPRGIVILNHNSLTCAAGVTLSLSAPVPAARPPVVCTIRAPGVGDTVRVGDTRVERPCEAEVTFTDVGQYKVTLQFDFAAYDTSFKVINVNVEEPSTAVPELMAVPPDEEEEGSRIHPAVGVTVAFVGGLAVLVIVLAVYVVIHRRRQSRKKIVRTPSTSKSVLLRKESPKDSDVKRQLSRLLTSQVSRNYMRMSSGSPTPTKPRTLRLLRQVWQEGDPRQVAEVAPQALSQDGELDLSGFTRAFTGENLRAVAFFVRNCPQLRVVNFARSWICDVVMRDISVSLAANQDIRQIILWGNRISSTSVFYMSQVVKSCHHLETLDLSHNLVGDTAKTKLKDIMEMSTKMELWISDNGLSSTLAEMGMKVYGNRLDLGVQGYIETDRTGNQDPVKYGGQDPLLDPVPDPSDLPPWERRIQIASTLTSFYTLYHSSKPAKIVQLESVILTGCCTVLDLGCLSTGASLTLLKAVNLLIQHSRVLRKLCLQKNDITDEGVACFTSLNRSRSLDQIELWENEITNVGMGFLCNQLRSCGRLVCLKLNFNKIKDEEESQIESFLDGNVFLELWLSGNEISKERQKELAKKYKDRLDVTIPDLPNSWSMSV